MSGPNGRRHAPSAHAFGALRALAIGVGISLSLVATGCNSVPARRALDEALAAGQPGEATCIDPCLLGMAPSLPTPEPPPLPYCPVDPLAEPLVARSEYLCDGGDHGLPVRVDSDWQIEGLETEDTVAHYDSPVGCPNVSPSNCVCIYAPRFGSIRQIVVPIINEQVAGPNALNLPAGLVKFAERQEPTSTLQNLPLQVGITRRKAVEMEGESPPSTLSNVVRLEAIQDALAPYENFAVIRAGYFEQSEKPYLAKSIEAAVVWTLNQAVEVLVDHQAANEVVRDQGTETVYTYEEIPGCPMLRVIKVASTQLANPGDFVDFTIRFDNVGTKTAGNVTIVDSLTTRLEYVPDSAQASVKANFSTSPNDAGSDVLRWEIVDPVKRGEGGVVKFRAQVR